MGGLQWAQERVGAPAGRAPGGLRLVSAGGSEEPRTTRIPLDCDTWIDHALAMLDLAGLEEVSIVAAGSVHGNVPAPLGALNTLRALELAGLDDEPVRIAPRSLVPGS